MKELQVTLYDVLGYLIPGGVAFIGVVILIWTGFQTEPADLDRLSVHGWIACGVLSYLCGHLIQAIANLLILAIPSHLSLLTTGNAPLLSQSILEAAQRKVKMLTGIDPTINFNHKDLWELCDNLVLEQGKTETRDVYVYREGFYRGMVIASGVLLTAFVVRLPFAASIVKSGGVSYVFDRGHIIVALVLSVMAAILFFQRYRRFGRYLTRFSIFGALAIKSADAKSPAP